ncbi:MAG TPA: ThuA domain-containing protein [Phycisphaerae bacterium]|nr:ThuA domain-containing protein [Phycisphaerae bacterium]HRW53985.1 ThuA domain-containing protein [Phycisphaerae bacterium]
MNFSRILLWATILHSSVVATAAAPPRQTDPSELGPGVSYRAYQVAPGISRVCEPAPGQTPNVSERRDTIYFDGADFGLEDDFIAVVTGYLNVEAPGVHTMRLTSDDGSILFIDNERVVWNQGPHSKQDADGAVRLDAGLHPLRILYFEGAVDQHLSLSWKRPDTDAFELVPSSALRTEKNITRVVSPGVKKTSMDVEGIRPGDGIPLESVHPGWRVETIHPDDFQPMVGCMAWLPDGRLLVGTFEPRNNGIILTRPNGTLWALSNLSAGDPNDIKVERLAEGFYHPLGACVVDGAIYVAQRDEITKLEDSDGNGTFETRTTLASGWISDNYHHFTFGLDHHDGYLYATLSVAMEYGDNELIEGEIRGKNYPNPPHRGDAMKINIRTGEIEYLAGGLRTPNGVLANPRGDVFVGENQGGWTPASKINQIVKGAFYGHYNECGARTRRYPASGAPSDFVEHPVRLPALWLPQNELANSPTSMLWIDAGPFKDQMLIGELTMGGIRRANLEEVHGQLQGAVFRFTQGFEGGVNRLCRGPGGAIYVGCIGEYWDWAWRGTRTGLQRLVPTGAPVFEFHSMCARTDGFEIRFTDSVPRAMLETPSYYTMKQWRYVPTPEYGGPKVDEEVLFVSKADAAADGKSVRITVPGLKPGRLVYLRTDLRSETGERLWSPEAWYTLNEIPGAASRAERAAESNTKETRVLVFSKTTGFRHESIPDGVRAIHEICDKDAIAVEASEDANQFNDDDLARFDVVVFLNTTGDILDPSQEAAFRRWYTSGRGFVGVHSASDTEYKWPWYGKLVGAWFRIHPHVQEATINVVDATHPATRHLTPTWIRTDEWYNFRELPVAGTRELLALDTSTFEGSTMASHHPICWCHAFDGGRAIYTAGGHTSESYAEPAFREHLRGAIRWAAGLDE